MHLRILLHAQAVLFRGTHGTGYWVGSTDGLDVMGEMPINQNRISETNLGL